MSDEQTPESLGKTAISRQNTALATLRTLPVTMTLLDCYLKNLESARSAGQRNPRQVLEALSYCITETISLFNKTAEDLSEQAPKIRQTLLQLQQALEDEKTALEKLQNVSRSATSNDTH